jgi:deoxyribodipyrimidine photolyase
MTDPAAPRRIVLWFRNDLRLRDSAIVHQAVQKLQAKKFDEVRPNAVCWITNQRALAVSAFGTR